MIFGDSKNDLCLNQRVHIFEIVLDKGYSLRDEVKIWPKETSYHEIYANSELLVTDYSSAVFDFAYLQKPVIYAQFDKNEFFCGRHVSTKGYFDYERDGFGEVEYDLDSTVDRIIEYMANDCQRVYEKIMENAANSERERKA